MNRTTKGSLVAALALVGAACIEPTNQGSQALLLQQSFESLPVSFHETTNSFAGDDSDGMTPFVPQRRHEGRGGNGGFSGFGGEFGGGHGKGGKGHRGDGLFGGLMGGGLYEDFYGGKGNWGPGRGHKPFDSTATATCAFVASSGRVVCDPVTKRGLTITRSFQYRNAAGAVQQARDSVTTSSVNTQTTVAGTLVRRDSSTSVVSHKSERTTTGVAKGTTQITVDATASGTETTTGTSEQGSFTSVRTVGDTASGIVVPIQDGRPTYPTAGSVVRNMTITITVQGQSPASSTRREVVTYDGSATAKVVITQDGTARSCTLPLPRGKMTCQ